MESKPEVHLVAKQPEQIYQVAIVTAVREGLVVGVVILVGGGFGVCGERGGCIRYHHVGLDLGGGGGGGYKGG